MYKSQTERERRLIVTVASFVVVLKCPCISLCLYMWVYEWVYNFQMLLRLPKAFTSICCDKIANFGVICQATRMYAIHSFCSHCLNMDWCHTFKPTYIMLELVSTEWYSQIFDCHTFSTWKFQFSNCFLLFVLNLHNMIKLI